MKVAVIPIIFETLGVIPKKLEKWWENKKSKEEQRLTRL